MIIKAGGKKFTPPLFFPDATQGVVRNLSTHDLQQIGIRGVVVNTLHLMSQPGEKLIRRQGGIKKFMNWPGLVVSDSGGFQIMSMIHKNRCPGQITPLGVHFTLTSSFGEKPLLLTPEKSIQVQFDLGTDIIVALDYFTPPQAGLKEIKKSVDQTIEWGRRAKEEYRRQLKKRQIALSKKPLLLAVIQGGRNKKERERCAKGLRQIGFDGYGFGGWIIDSQGKLDREISRFNAQLTPEDKLRFALGVGKPQDIVDCWQMGYHFFDCVLPTRDARHRRLYILKVKAKRLVHQYFYTPQKNLCPRQPPGRSSM